LRYPLRSREIKSISLSTHPLLQTICCLFLMFVGSVYPTTASGQADELDLNLWAFTADRAVEVLAESDATSDELEELRGTLSDQRGDALEAQDRLRLRVETLEGELASLGAAPEDESSEAPEIAQRREALNAALADARVPLVEAQAAYERANGLISEIDDEVRRRISAELTSLGPSPVNPVHWPKAASEMTRTGQGVLDAFGRIWRDPEGRAELLSRTPFAVLLILLGLFVQFSGKPRAIQSLTDKLHAATGRRARMIWQAALNAVRNLLPLFAAVAVILGLDQLVPRLSEEVSLADVLLPMALVVILAYWLSNALFLPNDQGQAVVAMEERAARSGRRNTLLIALTLAFVVLVRFIGRQADLSNSTVAILMLPLFVVGGLFLARLAIALRSPPPSSEEDVEDGEAKAQPATFVIRDALSRAGLAIAFIVPVLAVVGYLSAANALFGPTVFTLALIGGLVAVYTKCRDAFDLWLNAGGDGAANSRRRLRAVPLIGGFVLTCLAVPLLALIWGARVSELQEVWIWLRDGVTIGDVRLSVTDVLAFILVFAIGYTITRMIQAVVRGSVLPRMDLDRGASNAIISGIGYVGIFLAAVIAISATGLSLGNLAIVAGALSVGIGFGLQAVVSNFVSGIILLVERPIKEGDWIEVAGFSGYVRKISVRSTLIDTFDRASVIVPNSELIAGTVLNWTHSEMTGRVIVPVGVAYGEDPRKVEAILMDIAQGHPMVLRRPAPAVVFQGFGPDSMDFEIRAFLRDVNWMLSAKSEMNFSIVRRFEEAGIEIPYAQRDINLRNVDEAAKAFWKGKMDQGA